MALAGNKDVTDVVFHIEDKANNGDHAVTIKDELGLQELGKLSFLWDKH